MTKHETTRAAGDNLDRWHEDIVADEWQAEAWAEGPARHCRPAGRRKTAQATAPITADTLKKPICRA